MIRNPRDAHTVSAYVEISSLIRTKLLKCVSLMIMYVAWSEHEWVSFEVRYGVRDGNRPTCGDCATYLIRIE